LNISTHFFHDLLLKFNNTPVTLLYTRAILNVVYCSDAFKQCECWACVCLLMESFVVNHICAGCVAFKCENSAQVQMWQYVDYNNNKSRWCVIMFNTVIAGELSNSSVEEWKDHLKCFIPCASKTVSNTTHNNTSLHHPPHHTPHTTHHTTHSHHTSHHTSHITSHITHHITHHNFSFLPSLFPLSISSPSLSPLFSPLSFLLFSFLPLSPLSSPLSLFLSFVLFLYFFIFVLVMVNIYLLGVVAMVVSCSWMPYL
jgi:hypothetical protein